MNRRGFLKLGAASLAAGLVGGVGYAAFNDVSQDLTVERVIVPIHSLPEALEGFTIAQLSDIHLRPLTKPLLVQRAVALTNSLKPDLVVLTGDFVWREVESIFELAPIIAELNARFGVYGIYGNHELWTDVDVIQAGMKQAGIPLLVNQGATLHVNGTALHLAGLDDGWSGNPDMEAAMENAPAGATTILLLHEPDLADTYSLDPRLALQLAGHSHGGQIRLPGIGALVLPYLAQKYDLGLYRVGEMWLYTNRGIGVTNEPIRLNCPPEITLLTLTKL